MSMMTCSECENQYSDLAEKCPHCGCENPFYIPPMTGKAKNNKKGLFLGITVFVLVIILALVIIFLLVPVIKNGKIGNKPVPFTDADWGATMDEVESLQGNPDDEYEVDDGYVYQYNNCTVDGYTGITRYVFDNEGLFEVIFVIEGSQALEAYSYYEEKYQNDYGTPDFENMVGKIWYEEKANYGIASTPLGSIETMVSYGMPTGGK